MYYAHRFFSTWAIVAHVISLFVPSLNTFSIATTVLVGSEIINACLNEQYDRDFHVIVHYVPFVLVAIAKPIAWQWEPLGLLALAYVVCSDMDRVTEYYRYPKDYLLNRKM